MDRFMARSITRADITWSAKGVSLSLFYSNRELTTGTLKSHSIEVYGFIGDEQLFHLLLLSTF